MARKYDISKKSDMRRLQRDLEKTIKQKATSSIKGGRYEVTCPHCGAKPKVPVGRSSCPYCHNLIDLNLDIKW